MNKDILHAPLPKGPAGQFGFHLLQSNMLMKYSKNQDAAKEFLKWLHSEANYRKFFESQKGFATPCTAKWESDKLWDVDPVMTPYKVAATSRPGHRQRRTAQRQGPGSALEVHRHRHVRQGRAGHAGRGIGEVGRVRAEEGLRRETRRRSRNARSE